MPTAFYLRGGALGYQAYVPMGRRTTHLCAGCKTLFIVFNLSRKMQPGVSTLLAYLISDE